MGLIGGCPTSESFCNSVVPMNITNGNANTYNNKGTYTFI